jgi:hypothetical protein
MKVIPDFEQELKAIDSRIDIIPNPNRGPNEENKQGISNIKLGGQDICPIPSDEIFDEPNDNYGYLFPTQVRRSRFKTRPEAIAMVQNILKIMETDDGRDAFLGKGDYDDKKK